MKLADADPAPPAWLLRQLTVFITGPAERASAFAKEKGPESTCFPGLKRAGVVSVDYLEWSAITTGRLPGWMAQRQQVGRGTRMLTTALFYRSHRERSTELGIPMATVVSAIRENHHSSYEVKVRRRGAAGRL